MALESPNLDDRTFEQLLTDAKRRVVQSCPGWELTPSDPGVVLLEAFAYITDLMLYRLNRVPVKAYIEFLRLMGISLYPPNAARAELQFSLNALAISGNESLKTPQSKKVCLTSSQPGDCVSATATIPTKTTVLASATAALRRPWPPERAPPRMRDPRSAGSSGGPARRSPSLATGAGSTQAGRSSAARRAPC